MEEKIKKIMGDEDLMCDFLVTLSEQMASDEEPAYKKFKKLYASYVENPKLVNDVLMTLCGWTMESLVEMTLGEY
jgi:hypothetical protein